jgi:hypothetical protein
MHTNKLFLALPLILVLSGCALTEPVIKVVTQKVEVPVPVACKEEIPAVPEYCFTKLGQDSDIYDKTKCLLSDRERSLGYETELLAKLKACK